MNICIFHKKISSIIMTSFSNNIQRTVIRHCNLIWKKTLQPTFNNSNKLVACIEVFVSTVCEFLKSCSYFNILIQWSHIFMKITFLGLLHIENLHKYELKNLVFWFLSALTFFFTHRPIYDMKTFSMEHKR